MTSGRILEQMATTDLASTREFPDPQPAPSRRSGGDEAADYIRTLIFQGHLRAGERIPQDQIAELLSLSRIPIREGLVALERDGWITLELNRGAFVNALDADAVRDSYELYGILYGFATRRAIARSRSGLVDQLASIEAAMRNTDEPDAFHAHTIEFHNTIVDASRSPRVKAMVRVSKGLVAGNFFAQIPGSIEVERRFAKRIVRALQADDVDAAVEDYRKMMVQQGKLVVKVFKDRGLFDRAGCPPGA